MYRLPPELIQLCAIFVSCTDPRPIVTLTHVCRYWRGALTSNPKRWASISSKWERLIPLCLSRSGSVPLTVDLSTSRITWDCILPLRSHVARISDLTLTGNLPMETMETVLLGSFSPMRSLISLKVRWSEPADEFFPPEESPVPRLFRNVSNLKVLHLSQVPIYSTLSNLQSLVELRLGNYRIPFMKFIGFLESNTTLEIVTLSLRFVKDSASTVPKSMVSLPRLQHLVFTCDDAIDVRRLFSWLYFPRGINVEVRTSVMNRCYDLASFLPRTRGPIHDHLAPVTIKYQTSPRRLYLSGNNGSFSFYPQGTPSTEYEEFGLFTTEAVRGFRLRTPRRETIGKSDFLSPALKRLPALEALVIDNTPFDSKYLSALSQKPLLCQSLKTIAFYQCPLDSAFILALKAVAKQRRNGSQLHRVVVINNGVPGSGLISQLQKFIPLVDVVPPGGELPDLL